MKLVALGDQIAAHPRAARAGAFAVVCLSAFFFVRTVQAYTEFSRLLADRASDAARQASEALGG